MARTVNKEQTEKRRLQILQAALECFTKQGFHQSSMQTICKKAGLSPGTVYHYFKSKDDIIEHIAQREVDSAQEFAALLDASATLEGGLNATIEYILGSGEYTDTIQVYLEVVCEAGRNRKVGKKLLKAEEIALKAIRKWLKKESVSMPDVSAEVLAQFIVGQIELLELFKRYDPPAKQCAEMARLSKATLRMLLEK